MTEPLNQFTVLTTIATSGSSGGLEAVYQDVYDFHAMLAKKYSVVGNLPPSPPPATTAYRVAYGPAGLHSGPGTTFPIMSYSKTGDTLQADATSGEWLHTTAGWILLKQVVKV